MSKPLKIGLYVVLVPLVLFLAFKSFLAFQQVISARPVNGEAAEPPEAPPPTEGPAEPESGEGSGAAAQPPASREESQDPPAPARNKAAGLLFTYLAALLGAAALLGVLIASDVSRYMAEKTEEFLFNDDGKGMSSREYEEAEKVWANGEPLDAIRLMRDYLQRHPREQYVALRIAEIYEKDLHNYLAAALEYEEVLKKKLPPERWGWAAIHLANLYSGKLGRIDEAVALLRRIESDYGQTSAANKARQRLARFDAAGAAGLTEESVS